MIFSRPIVKIFATEESSVETSEFIAIFQAWIRDKTLPDTMIDVADYGHVDAGPGVLLACHEANYYVDQAAHRLGLLYQGKTVSEGDDETRLRRALAAAIRASLLLEDAKSLAGRLLFRCDEFWIGVNDRLVARNERPDQEKLADVIRGVGVALRPAASFACEPVSLDPKDRCMLSVKLKNPTPLRELLQNLTAKSA